MKEIYLALIILLGDVQSSFSMSEKVKNLLFGGSLLILQQVYLNQYLKQKSTQEFATYKKNFDEFSQTEKRNIEIVLNDIKKRSDFTGTIIPILYENGYAATRANFSNPTEHALLLSPELMDQLKTNQITLVTRAALLHEVAHMKKNHFINGFKLIRACGGAITALCLVHIKFATFLLSMFILKPFLEAYQEDQADETGPFALGTIDELEAELNIFKLIEAHQNKMLPSKLLLEKTRYYHPARGYSRRRVELRLKILKKQQAINAEIEKLKPLAKAVRTPEVQNQLAQLEKQYNDLTKKWKYSRSTPGRIWDGFRTYFDRLSAESDVEIIETESL
jgi:hypothetical protein